MKSWKKIFIAVIFLVLAVAFQNNGAKASDEAEKYIFDAVEEISKDIDFDVLDGGSNPFDGDTKTNIYSIINGDFPFDLKSLLTVVLGVFVGDVKAMLGMFFSIIAISLIVSVINGLGNLSTNKTLINLVNFISVAIIFSLTSGSFVSVFDSVLKSLQYQSKQVDAAVPIMLTLIVAGGGSTSAKVLSPSVAFLIDCIVFAVKRFLVPIVVLLFVFSVISAFSSNIKVNKVRDFLKSLFKWIIGITVVLFNFFITIEGITTSLYDGVSVKALKYALQSSFPIVGSLVGGGFDITVASVLLIKNAVGIFSIIAILAVSLTPIIKIAALMLFLRLLSAVCEPIGSVKLTQFFSSGADALGYLNATAVLSMLSFIVAYLVLIFSLSGAL